MLEELNKQIKKGSIEIEDKSYELEFFLGGDYKAKAYMYILLYKYFTSFFHNSIYCYFLVWMPPFQTTRVCGVTSIEIIGNNFVMYAHNVDCHNLFLQVGYEQVSY